MNPKFTDYDFSEMFEKQADMESSREKSYENFIKNKLHYLDSEYDYNFSHENLIFKTKNHQQVDLENYKTILDSSGIEIQKHDNNRLNTNL